MPGHDAQVRPVHRSARPARKGKRGYIHRVHNTRERQLLVLCSYGLPGAGESLQGRPEVELVHQSPDGRLVGGPQAQLEAPLCAGTDGVQGSPPLQRARQNERLSRPHPILRYGASPQGLINTPDAAASEPGGLGAVHDHAVLLRLGLVGCGVDEEFLVDLENLLCPALLHGPLLQTLLALLVDVQVVALVRLDWLRSHGGQRHSSRRRLLRHLLAGRGPADQRRLHPRSRHGVEAAALDTRPRQGL
mmetsp:Transcript_13445/g.26702  ORF Transcript_13445/g.26702 Transcript_13445/m.26702 type:complete len:247 (+) Transcript_13445:262-1002(+)